jgi:bacteriocin-like protein
MRELTDEELEHVIGGIAIGDINVANIANSQVLQGNTVQAQATVNVSPYAYTPVTVPITTNS